MKSILKLSICVFVLSTSFQKLALAHHDDVIVDYCAHYAAEVAKGARYIDYPNAELVSTIAYYVATGAPIVSTTIAASAIWSRDYRLLPAAVCSGLLFIVADAFRDRFAFLDLCFKRRAKCASLGLLPSDHNRKKDPDSGQPKTEL